MFMTVVIVSVLLIPAVLFVICTPLPTNHPRNTTSTTTQRIPYVEYHDVSEYANGEPHFWPHRYNRVPRWVFKNKTREENNRPSQIPDDKNKPGQHERTPRSEFASPDNCSVLTVNDSAILSIDREEMVHKNNETVTMMEKDKEVKNISASQVYPGSLLMALTKTSPDKEAVERSNKILMDTERDENHQSYGSNMFRNNAEKSLSNSTSDLQINAVLLQEVVSIPSNPVDTSSGQNSSAEISTDTPEQTTVWNENIIQDYHDLEIGPNDSSSSSEIGFSPLLKDVARNKKEDTLFSNSMDAMPLKTVFDDIALPTNLDEIGSTTKDLESKVLEKNSNTDILKQKPGSFLKKIIKRNIPYDDNYTQGTLDKTEEIHGQLFLSANESLHALSTENSNIKEDKLQEYKPIINIVFYMALVILWVCLVIFWITCIYVACRMDRVVDT